MSQKHQQLHEKEILSTSTTMTFTSKNFPSPDAPPPPQNFPPSPPQNDENLELVQQQMKYVAYQQQRSTPPRCHPISIYILVQSLGCILTGLTMVITAHWPGTGSRSSGILKIVGPILIAIGVLLFIIGILLARFLRKKEVKKWNKKVSQIVQSASRQVLDQSATMQQQSRQQQQSRLQQPKPIAGPGSEEERIELLSSPDSIDKKMLGGKMAAASSSGSDAFIAVGDNEDVPEAVRMMKKRTKKKPGDASSSFENLQSVDEELGQGQRSGSRELYKTGREKSRSREEIQERENEEEEEEEYITGRKKIVTKTTTVVKTTTTKTKPEIKTRPETKPPAVPDSPRLRIKIKATPGTQVNVRHSGTESESEDSKQKAKVQEKPKPKPKPKSKTRGGTDGTDI